MCKDQEKGEATRKREAAGRSTIGKNPSDGRKPNKGVTRDERKNKLYTGSKICLQNDTQSNTRLEFKHSQFNVHARDLVHPKRIN